MVSKTGRPMREINLKRQERFKTFLEDQKENGITQKKLAEMLFISQQTISKIANKSGNLTEETAERISKLFPQYRLQWLLGFDDFKTDDERINASINRRAEYIDLTEQLLFSHGYTITETLYPLDGHEKKSQTLLIEITSPSGNTRYMKTKEYMDFLKSINDVVEGLLLLQFKQNTDTAKEYWRR